MGILLEHVIKYPDLNTSARLLLSQMPKPLNNLSAGYFSADDNC